MSRLLNDLQTLSTAEAGALTLHREPTRAADLIDDAVRSFAAQASEAGVRLEPSVAEPIAEVEVDRLRIGEVLGNLLSNALRHTPSGGVVTVAAAAAPDGRRARRSPTAGPGSRPTGSRTCSTGSRRLPDSRGAGLGLAIAKTLVEAHGGRIRAESDPTGTTISFVLPR